MSDSNDDVFKRPGSRAARSLSSDAATGWLPPPIPSTIGAAADTASYSASDLFKYTSAAMSPTGRGIPGRGRMPSGVTIDPSLTLPPIRDPRYLQGPLSRSSLDRNSPSYPSSSLDFPLSTSLSREYPGPPRLASRGRGYSASNTMYSTSGPIPPLYGMSSGSSYLDPSRARRASIMDMDLPPMPSLPSLGYSSLSSSGSSRASSLSPIPLSGTSGPGRTSLSSSLGASSQKRPAEESYPNQPTDPDITSEEDDFFDANQSVSGVPPAGEESTSHASRGLRKFSKRTTFSQYQLGLMEQLWAKTEYPSVEQVDRCADMCNLTPKQIRTWFGNTRQARLAGTRKEARTAGAAMYATNAANLDPTASRRAGRIFDDKLPPISRSATSTGSRGRFVPLGTGLSSGLPPIGSRSTLYSLPMFPPPPGSPSRSRGGSSLPPLPPLGGTRSRRNSFTVSGDRFPGASLPDYPSSSRYPSSSARGSSMEQ